MTMMIKMAVAMINNIQTVMVIIIIIYNNSNGNNIQ